MVAIAPQPTDPVLIAPDDFESLMGRFGPFETNPQLAVAVSGGADSMALLVLVNNWAKKRDGTAIALTVDHGLRTESAQEAQTVQNWCKARNIAHHTLRWQPPPLPSALQAQARQARYQLLTDWCKAHHTLHLLTAHHRDDQAETFFFRVGRGSGLEGLACMAPIVYRQDVRLLRPLLGVSHEQLKWTLTHFGQLWIEDPTNKKMEYTRNYLRSVLAKEMNYPTTSTRASLLTDFFADFSNLLNHKLADQLPSAISLFPEGYATLDLPTFLNLQPEYALRTLAALTATLSGEPHPPRTEKLERLCARIASGTLSGRCTLAGLLFIHQPLKKRLLVCREPRAIGSPVSLNDNIPTLWDRRFLISVNQFAAPDRTLTVKNLGTAGLAELKDSPKIRRIREKSILKALPAIWSLERLAAVPHLHYTNPDFIALKCRALFYPPKPLAGQTFSAMNKRYN